MSDPKHLVVVGNGMVGQRFVEELVDRDDGAWHVTVLAAEPVPAYDRVSLSSLFDGATLDDLTLADADTFQNHRVELHLNCAVDSIDRDERVVHVRDGGEGPVPYDHLVLATGSDPFVPPIPGADLDGCFVYRTFEDLEAIRQWASSDTVRSGIVIGGGLLGLEAANALHNLGLDTHVVEMADRLMPQQLDGPASAVLRKAVHDLDVSTHLSFATDRIEGDDGRIHSIVEKDGTRIEAQMLVFSAGIRPRHQIGEAAGLVIGERGGIVIDERCMTSDSAISAIGEVACHQARVHGLVAPGYEMARTLASVLTGENKDLDIAQTPTKLKLLGVDLATFGDPTGDAGPDAERITFEDPRSGIHRRVTVADGVVVGGVCVGDLSSFDLLASLVGTKLDGLPSAPDIGKLIIPLSLLGETVAFELPDDALVCSCNNVTRGEVKCAIADGSHDVGTLCANTRAGTGCGGCKPDVSSLLVEELERLGIEVDRSICEHFALSRQQLFDLIRFHQHRSWSEVLTSHGRGRGCDVCRPAVASILASLANGYVLDGDQAAIQDTNDHALANMQRNGTYSVIPRIPGGEVTPRQLIELGQIAEDFNLYAKITGGQRVDLLGASLHELPLIWQRVLDVGLESGHAYGKALRTVKSCVGEVWCRYGVQDAVGMAIRVEKRYRGLRSPHKLKSAVSGCTRECAEAQSKDFGLIATETGWNLYLCGNGGRTPRHADLFATDLNEEEVIRYLDRFLMFYIRTADRLQRTAAWFEQLEGGLDYLRSVIIDDSLGIAEELEADLARHVETYQCEWEATLADPDRLEHFVEFVNAPDQHSTPVWITERSQRVPAPSGAAT